MITLGLSDTLKLIKILTRYYTCGDHLSIAEYNLKYSTNKLQVM
jgi:hypothetical protein